MVLGNASNYTELNTVYLIGIYYLINMLYTAYRIYRKPELKGKEHILHTLYAILPIRTANNTFLDTVLYPVTYLQKGNDPKDTYYNQLTVNGPPYIESMKGRFPNFEELEQNREFDVGKLFTEFKKSRDIKDPLSINFPGRDILKEQAEKEEEERKKNPAAYAAKKAAAAKAAGMTGPTGMAGITSVAKGPTGTAGTVGPTGTAGTVAGPTGTAGTAGTAGTKDKIDTFVEKHSDKVEAVRADAREGLKGMIEQSKAAAQSPLRPGKGSINPKYITPPSTSVFAPRKPGQPSRFAGIQNKLMGPQGVSKPKLDNMITSSAGRIFAQNPGAFAKGMMGRY
jgi:hypothetical protein